MVFYDSIQRVTFIFELILILAHDCKRSISHFGNFGLKLISHFTLSSFILHRRENTSNDNTSNASISRTRG